MLRTKELGLNKQVFSNETALSENFSNFFFHHFVSNFSKISKKITEIMPTVITKIFKK